MITFSYIYIFFLSFCLFFIGYVHPFLYIYIHSYFFFSHTVGHFLLFIFFYSHCIKKKQKKSLLNIFTFFLCYVHSCFHFFSSINSSLLPSLRHFFFHFFNFHRQEKIKKGKSFCQAPFSFPSCSRLCNHARIISTDFLSLLRFLLTPFSSFLL